jgi:hypothetical protein
MEFGMVNDNVGANGLARSERLAVAKLNTTFVVGVVAVMRAVLELVVEVALRDLTCTVSTEKTFTEKENVPEGHVPRFVQVVPPLAEYSVLKALGSQVPLTTKTREPAVSVTLVPPIIRG